MPFLNNLEALRILFTMIIVYFHMMRVYLSIMFPDLYGTFSANVECAHLCVEFFFLLSGFLLFTTKEKQKTLLWTHFIVRKLARLYPAFAFSIILSILLLGNFKNTIDTHILDLLLMQGNGLLLTQGYNFNAWYVSSLFWTFALYFYLIKNYEHKNVMLLIALTVYLSLYIIIRTSLSEIDTYTKCMLRAFAGVGIGYFIGLLYNLCNKKKMIVYNKYQIVSSTCIEFALLYLLVKYTIFNKPDTYNALIFLIAFSILIWFFLIQCGVFSGLCNKKAFHFFSKYMYSTYIMQNLSFYFSMKYIWCYKNFVYSYPFCAIIGGLSLSIIFGIITYHLVESPFCQFLHKRLT